MISSPGVGLRLSSCIRKSSRLPEPRRKRDALDLVDVGIEARGSRQRPPVARRRRPPRSVLVQSSHGVAQAAGEPFLVLADPAQDDRCGVGDEFAHAGNPLEDHPRQSFFPRGRRSSSSRCRSPRGNFKQRRLHFIESEAVIGEHARQRSNSATRTAGGARHAGSPGASELPEQAVLSDQIARRGGVGLQVETAF